MTHKIISKPSGLIRSIQIPIGVIFLQCLTFVVLYSVWILPEIAAWRNTSLVIGAALGLYVSYQYRFLLLNKEALPIWLIVMLFIWASFHLLFLSQNCGGSVDGIVACGISDCVVSSCAGAESVGSSCAGAERISQRCSRAEGAVSLPTVLMA